MEPRSGQRFEPADDDTTITTGALPSARGGASLNDHRQLVLVRNNPQFNEMQPRAVVPYAQIYGIARAGGIAMVAQ